MKNKVRKFSAGDIVTGLGAVLVGKALYDKYKSKDDEESDYARKVKEFRTSKEDTAKPAEEPKATKAEPKEETREDYLAKKVKPIKTTGTFAGSDTSEPDLEYKSKPATKKATSAAQPKKAAPKKEAPVSGEKSQAFPRDDDDLNRRRLEGLKPPVTGKSTPKTIEDTSKKATKYGIGPYGAFGSIDKAISEYKTPAEIRSEEKRKRENKEMAGMKKGGMVKSSASKRADGIAQRGKTRGRIC
jgi:hypothetical protein